MPLIMPSSEIMHDHEMSPPSTRPSSAASTCTSGGPPNRTTSMDSLYTSSSSTSADKSTLLGQEYIPTRVTRTTPKINTQAMQFVKVGPAELYKSATEQLKKSEHVKQLRKQMITEEEDWQQPTSTPSSRIKDDAEDWQSNLDKWKSSRRKRNEEALERVIEVKKNEQDEEFQKRRRKSRTFSEMVDDKNKRGRRFNLVVHDDDNNDLGDLGLTSGGNSTVNEIAKTDSTPPPKDVYNDIKDTKSDAGFCTGSDTGSDGVFAEDNISDTSSALVNSEAFNKALQLEDTTFTENEEYSHNHSHKTEHSVNSSHTVSSSSHTSTEKSYQNVSSSIEQSYATESSNGYQSVRDTTENSYEEADKKLYSNGDSNEGNEYYDEIDPPNSVPNHTNGLENGANEENIYENIIEDHLYENIYEKVNEDNSTYSSNHENDHFYQTLDDAQEEKKIVASQAETQEVPFFVASSSGNSIGKSSDSFISSPPQPPPPVISQVTDVTWTEDHLRAVAPPSEPPPPPPPDEDDGSSTDEGEDGVYRHQAQNSQSSNDGDQSTSHIKKELQKRRSAFLGTSPVIVDEEPTIKPPPDLSELLREECEAERKLKEKFNLLSNDNQSLLDEKEVLRREKEIIESLEREEEQRRRYNWEDRHQEEEEDSSDTQELLHYNNDLNSPDLKAIDVNLVETQFNDHNINSNLEVILEQEPASDDSIVETSQEDSINGIEKPDITTLGYNSTSDSLDKLAFGLEQTEKFISNSTGDKINFKKHVINTNIDEYTKEINKNKSNNIPQHEIVDGQIANKDISPSNKADIKGILKPSIQSTIMNDQTYYNDPQTKNKSSIKEIEIDITYMPERNIICMEQYQQSDAKNPPKEKLTNKQDSFDKAYILEMASKPSARIVKSYSLDNEVEMGINNSNDRNNQALAQLEMEMVQHDQEMLQRTGQIHNIQTPPPHETSMHSRTSSTNDSLPTPKTSSDVTPSYSPRDAPQSQLQKPVPQPQSGPSLPLQEFYRAPIYKDGPPNQEIPPPIPSIEPPLLYHHNPPPPKANVSKGSPSHYASLASPHPFVHSHSASSIASSASSTYSSNSPREGITPEPLPRKKRAPPPVPEKSLDTAERIDAIRQSKHPGTGMQDNIGMHPHIEQEPIIDGTSGQNMSKQTLKALSAIPKPRLNDNDSWITKKKNETKTHYSKHWLIQEAEQRRIEQHQRQERSSKSSSQLQQSSLPPIPQQLIPTEHSNPTYQATSAMGSMQHHANYSEMTSNDTNQSYNQGLSYSSSSTSTMSYSNSSTNINNMINNNSNSIRRDQATTYQPRLPPQNNSNDKPLPDCIINSLTQRVNNKNKGAIPNGKHYNNNYHNDENYHDYMNADSLVSTMQGGNQSSGFHPNTSPSINMNPTNQSLEDQKLLSVSGKKKCSHCGDELGRGAAMIIESLRLFYHIPCFKCCVCGIQLGNGTAGADVRVRNHKLHCHNCYSNDEGMKFSKV